MTGTLNQWGTLLLALAVMIIMLVISGVNNRYLDWIKSRMTHRTYVVLTISGFFLAGMYITAAILPLLQQRNVTP